MTALSRILSPVDNLYARRKAALALLNTRSLGTRIYHRNLHSDTPTGLACQMSSLVLMQSPSMRI